MRPSDLFDDYIDGKMNLAERERFEAQLAADEVLANALDEHLQLLAALERSYRIALNIWKHRFCRNTGKKDR